MKRKEIYLFGYCVVFLLASFYLYHSFRPKPLVYNPDIPLPESTIRYNSESVFLTFKNRKGYKVQIVNFSHTNPDTSILDADQFEIETHKNCNRSLYSYNSSHKWRPVAGRLPKFLVLGYRYVSLTDNEVGPFKYSSCFHNKSNLPVVSLIIDPNSFFDFNTGIYVAGKTQLFENGRSKEGNGWWLAAANWNNRGKEWEREAFMQFANEEGNLMYEKECGIRISGNATRGFSQKSLRLKSRGHKKNKKFKHRFFLETSYYKFSSLVLRNSGNDWGKTKLADAFIQSLIPDSIIDRQAHLPVSLYINGLYWGMYDLCEKVDESYLAEKYNVKKSDITLLEGDQLEYGSVENRQDFMKLVSFSQKKDMAQIDNYNYLSSCIDMNNLATYLAIEIYAVNTDWPNVNVKIYKIGHEKWKFIVRDLDCSYSFSGRQAFQTDMFKRISASYGSMKIIFDACMKNKEFRELLKKKINFLLQNVFAPKIQMKSLDKFYKLIKTEIPLQIKRWRKPESIDVWNSNISNFKEFILKREQVLRLQMVNYLGK